jgi:hypothetical protein
MQVSEPEQIDRFGEAHGTDALFARVQAGGQFSGPNV